MNYRCFTCGFVQDFEPTEESSVVHHPWMAGLPFDACPACVQYLQVHGGRRNGKVEMPDINEPGVLTAETPDVILKIDELNKDFRDLHSDLHANDVKRLENKHKGKKIFGWSVADIRDLHAKRGR